LAIRVWLDPIQAEKDDAGAQGRTLVSVYKWMVATKEEKICGSHLHKIGVGGLTSNACLRGGNCGFQQGHVSYSVRTAELDYGFSMNLKNYGNREMINVADGFRAHARRRIVRA
jgi:hypothetical protein